MDRNCYKLRDENMAADSKPLVLADQNVIWIRVVRWLVKRMDDDDFQLSKTTSLASYGYTFRTVGFPATG